MTGRGRSWTIRTVECPECGDEYSENNIEKHRDACEQTQRLPIYPGVVIEPAPRHVYVALLDVGSEMKLYVGQTRDIQGRLRGHTYGDMTITVPDDGCLVRTDYDVLGVLSVEPTAEDERIARYSERETFLELTQKCDYDVVAGGN